MITAQRAFSKYVDRKKKKEKKEEETPHNNMHFKEKVLKMKYWI